MAQAEGLAMMLANSRAANLIEVADLLAGMYISDWERLSRYWKDQEEIESFLQQICRISPQRWHHWIEHYNRQRGEGERRRPWRLLRVFRKEKRDRIILERTKELESTLKKAEEIAPFYDMVEGRKIPILTCESVLLCMAKSAESEIGRRLVLSGLDLARLEKEARFPRHAPLR